MGRKTLESLPNGEPLKDRINIVLTRDKDYKKDGTVVINSIEHLTAYMWLLETLKGVEVFVIGGGQIYEELLPFIDTTYVTKINHKFKADTYFPNLDKLDDWKLDNESEVHNEGGLEYKYTTYRRISEHE